MRSILSRSIHIVLVAAVLAAGCSNSEKESDLGVRKPIPAPWLEASTPSIPIATPVPATPAPTRTPLRTPLPPTPAPAPEIEPEAAKVFDEMDERFAGSKARAVQIASRLVMISSTRGYRNTMGINLKAQFPNRLMIAGRTTVEANDPQTTTTWKQGKIDWGCVSDGANMLIKKGPLKLRQEAPESLDAVLAQRIEIEGWGESFMFNGFLKTRPSEAFKASLRRARVIDRGGKEIRLELVTAPTVHLLQVSRVPPETDIVHQVTVDAETMVPRRCRIDLMELSRLMTETHAGKPVAVQEAFLEIEVIKADLDADFSHENPFVIPEEELSEARSMPAPPPGAR